MASSPHSAHLCTFNNVLSEGIQTYSSDMTDVASNHEYIPVSGNTCPRYSSTYTAPSALVNNAQIIVRRFDLEGIHSMPVLHCN